MRCEQNHTVKTPSVAVGCSPTGYPAKAFGTRRVRPWTESCPPCWTRRTAIPVGYTMGGNVAGKSHKLGWYREAGTASASASCGRSVL